MCKYELVLGMLLACSSVAQSPGPSAISLDSLLAEMTDRAALARFPSPAYTCRQFSSYDRASTTPSKTDTWFANADVDQFIREEKHAAEDGSERTEFVLMDTKSVPEVAGKPGAIVRFWSANPPKDATLRFYFDGQHKPGFQADMQTLLGGNHEFQIDAGEGGLIKARLAEPLAGIRAKGWNLYLPIPYAKDCKVTCDKRGFYYQINYRTYEPAATVETFNPARVRPASLRRAEQALRGMNWLARMAAMDVEFRPIAPGESVEVWSSQGTGSGAIEELRIACRSLPGNPVGLVVQAEFDGEVCMAAPVVTLAGGMDKFVDLTDFFRISKNGKGRHGGLEAQGVALRWIMPYRERASVRLVNRSEESIEAGALVRARDWTWDDRSMYFHAGWRREFPIHTNAAKGTLDWNYIDVKGQGVYVGDALAVANPVAPWWGEGDEKIYVEGETFPSHFGTGTEDYYSYAWCWPEPFQHPFHSQPRADGWIGPGKKWTNWGHTSVARVRALDAIPFHTSLKFDMEVWHWAQADVAYAATTFWYARPGATSNRDSIDALYDMVRQRIPEPPELPKPMTIAGAIECEAVEIIAKSPGLAVEIQELEGFATRVWSGGEHRWVKATKPGDFVELEVPCRSPAPVEVTLFATKSWDYGIVHFSVNGKLAAEVDLCSGEKGKVMATGPIQLGKHWPNSGSLVLRAEVIGSNPGSEGAKHFFGLDCVVLK